VILLLGGTADTDPIAEMLLAEGHPVLVSTATDHRLTLPTSEALCRHVGPLDDGELTTILKRECIRAIIDATHPYSVQISKLAFAIATREGVPYLGYRRPPAVPEDAPVRWADTHQAAARQAVETARPTLLTVGSRNLLAYAQAFREHRVRLIARLLDCSWSRRACHVAEHAEEDVIWGKGPFTVEQNLNQIAAHGIGTLVTKDGGVAGGVQEKLQAARQAGCIVIVVRRPESPGPSVDSISALAREVTRVLSHKERSYHDR
jgi:precorrin-6A/cobalt-precorrin-6A reductase